MENQETELKILSIDAWNSPEGWTWNQWYKIGTIEKSDFEELKTNRQKIKWFRDNGFISESSKGKVSIEDDQYNIVLLEKSNRRPLYAIEYGPVYN